MHKKGIEKSVLFLCPEKEKIEMEKKKVRATRTNGPKDSNGVFKACILYTSDAADEEDSEYIGR